MGWKEDLRWLVRRLAFWGAAAGIVWWGSSGHREFLAKVSASRERCAANLREIDLAIESYRVENEGRLPDHDGLAFLEALLDAGRLRPEAVAWSGGPTAARQSLSPVTCGYLGRRNGGQNRLDPWDRGAGAALVADRGCSSTFRHVLFADGAVQRIEEWTFRRFL